MMRFETVQDATNIATSVAIAGILIYFINAYLRRLKYIRMIEKIPGPPSKHFFLMHLHDMLKTQGEIPGYPNEFNVLPVFEKYARDFNADNYGLYRFWVLNPYLFPASVAAVHLQDPYLIKQLFLQQSKSIIREQNALKTCNSLFGGSFFTISERTSSKWKHQRKQVAAAMHLQVLERVNETINTILQQHLYKLLDDADSDNGIDFLPVSMRLTCEVFSNVAFNVTFGSFDTDAEDSLYNDFDFIVKELSLRLWDLPMQRFLRPTRYMRFKRATSRLDERIMGIIKKHNVDLAVSGKKGLNDDNNSTDDNKRRDLLHYLVRPDSDGNVLPLQTIFSNIRMLLFGGHETTGTVLALALWELAVNKDCQERLQAEVDRLFADDNKPGLSKINQLQYLNGVVLESLRTHPPAALARTSVEDITLTRENGDKYVIPANTEIYVLPNHVHDDPHLCSKPQKFDPERFNTGKGAADTTVGAPSVSFFFPFSIGSRNCVGYPMAMTELKVTLAYLMHRYSVSPATDVAPITFMGLTNKPHKVCVKFTKRSK